MGDGRLWLDPARATEGARDLAAAGADLRTQRATSGAAIAAATTRPPWGTDDIGRAFDAQYRPVEQQALLAWERLAAHVEQLGAAAAESVRDNLGADDDAGVRVRRTYDS